MSCTAEGSQDAQLDDGVRGELERALPLCRAVRQLGVEATGLDHASERGWLDAAGVWPTTQRMPVALAVLLFVFAAACSSEAGAGTDEGEVGEHYAR